MSETDPSGAFRNPKRTVGDAADLNKMLSSAGRAKACTSCRQVKVCCSSISPTCAFASWGHLLDIMQLKCNVADTFPARCSRCTSKNLDCRMDSNFKRIPTRQQVVHRVEEDACYRKLTIPSKLKEVTSELSSLKEAIKSQPQSAAHHQQQYGREDRSGSASQTTMSLPGFLSPGPGQSHLPHGHYPNPSVFPFYGIVDAQTASLNIGEHTIGDVVCSGPSIVTLFQQ